MPLSGRPFLIWLVPLLIMAGCGAESEDTGTATADPIAHGKEIYGDYCKLCHGADGRLGLNNASNLAQSQLNKGELIDVITNGRNAMQPYKNILSKQEINNVAEYILTLRTDN